ATSRNDSAPWASSSTSGRSASISRTACSPSSASLRDNSSPADRSPPAPMRIGVPKEIAPNERRVALTPDVAGRLVKGGYEVLIERGAGSAAFFPDAAYSTAGAKVSDRSSVFSQADIEVQVPAPHSAEIGHQRAVSELV